MPPTADKVIPFTVSSGAVQTPSWNSTFASLPNAPVGVPYSVDLKTYGVNVQRVFAISTNRPHAALSMWPAGLTLNSNTGVLSGTPTTAGQLAVVRALGANGTFDEAGDWAARTALSGITYSQNFPNSASVTDVSATLSGNPALSVWDPSIKLYGAGSLRQDTPDEAEYSGVFPHTPGSINGEANWAAPFMGGTLTSPVTLQVGQEAWLSWSARYDWNEVKWPYAAQGGGTQHDLKVGIVHKPPLTVDTGTMVLTTRWASYNGYTYGGGPITDNWEFKLGNVNTACGSDFVFNPDVADPTLAGVDPGLPSGSGIGAPWTACQQERAQRGLLYQYESVQGKIDGFPDPIHGGWVQPIDYWISYMVRMVRLTATSTRQEWYMAYLGQDWGLIYSNTLSHAGEYGQLTLTQSHTNQLAEIGVRPNISRWYDGVIARTGATRIPAPGLNSYRVAETIFAVRTV